MSQIAAAAHRGWLRCYSPIDALCVCPYYYYPYSLLMIYLSLRHPLANHFHIVHAPPRTTLYIILLLRTVAHSLLRIIIIILFIITSFNF